jgi:hypothetical protein
MAAKRTAMNVVKKVLMPLPRILLSLTCVSGGYRLLVIIVLLENPGAGRSTGTEYTEVRIVIKPPVYVRAWVGPGQSSTFYILPRMLP